MKRRFLHNRRQACHAMVLLEVVMALGIFILVAFSLVITLDAAMDAAVERNEIDEAMRGLENQMALLHLDLVRPIDRDLPDDSFGITYHLTIEPEQMQDQKHQPVLNMYRATITAKWKSIGQMEDRSISELIYEP